MRRTSVVVQGRNDGIVDDARLVIGAGGTPAVDARMSSLFNFPRKELGELLCGMACDAGNITIATEQC